MLRLRMIKRPNQTSYKPSPVVVVRMVTRRDRRYSVSTRPHTDLGYSFPCSFFLGFLHGQGSTGPIYYIIIPVLDLVRGGRLANIGPADVMVELS